MSDEEEGISDEEFSCELLRKYLEAQELSGFQVRVHPNDPPDIVVKMKNGDRWGVEVTRVYQEAMGYNKEKIMSSKDLIVPLRQYGEELDRITRNQRTRDYILFLGLLGPEPDDPLNQNAVLFDKNGRLKRGHLFANILKEMVIKR